jgi:chromosomal replication initiation ATPase DnaA
MTKKKDNPIISPYAFAGLPSSEATKARTNYFMKKVRQAKQLYANSEGAHKPFYEVKCDRLVIALEQFTGITKEELLAYNKITHLADIRNVVFAVAVRLRLGSLKALATYFNRKCHSSVHYAAEQGHIRIKEDPDLNDLYKKLVHSIT